MWFSFTSALSFRETKKESAMPSGPSLPGGDAVDRREISLVLGTAGHIDHGKTTLVKAITGVDCDRLSEEKSGE
jgi:Translation initiation factor 2, gamma subunit (eIF-2gamma; GTPase)